MPKCIFIANLTKDAEVKSHEGRQYVLLQVAENIVKRDSNGKVIKNDQGHHETSATFYYSVFVNRGELAFQTQNLKKGHAIKLSVIPKWKEVLDSNGHTQYQLDHMIASWVDTDPFSKVNIKENNSR